MAVLFSIKTGRRSCFFKILVFLVLKKREKDISVENMLLNIILIW